MQERDTAVAEATLLDLTSAKRQNKVCESQIPHSKEGKTCNIGRKRMWNWCDGSAC